MEKVRRTAVQCDLTQYVIMQQYKSYLFLLNSLYYCHVFVTTSLCFVLSPYSRKGPKKDTSEGTTGVVTAASILAAHPKDDSHFLEKRGLRNCLNLTVVHSKLFTSIYLAHQIKARQGKYQLLAMKIFLYKGG